MPTPNQPQAEPETIDITPTWEGSLRFYLSILESTQPQQKARALVRAELRTLARWADKRQKQEDTAVAATVAVAVEEIDRIVQVSALTEENATAAIVRIQAAAKGEQARRCPECQGGTEGHADWCPHAGTAANQRQERIDAEENQA